jgi:hypothetical protein
MKNVFTLLALCSLILSSFSLSAQTSFFGGANVGYNGKVILKQNNYGQRLMDYEFEGALNYGLSLGLDFGNKHILQLEALFINGGQSYNHQYDGFSLSKQANLSYLQVPLTYRLVAKKRGQDANTGTSFHLLMGAYVGFLQGVDMSTQINGEEATFYDFVNYRTQNPNSQFLNSQIPDGTNPDFDNLFTETDFGVLAGLGIQSFLTKELKLITELRAGYSLEDINAESWRLTSSRGEYIESRNLFASLQLGLVYYISL